MVSNYEIVFTINILHDYYKNGMSKDFDLVPTLQTKGILKNHRCLLKHTPTGSILLYHAEKKRKPLIPLGKEQSLVFILNLNNTGFLNITQLPDKGDPKQVYYLNDFKAKKGKGMTWETRSLKSLGIQDEQFNGSAIYGVIEISRKDFDYSNPRNFNIQFRARAARWTYHVTLTKDYQEANFSILDKEKDLEQPRAVIQFNETTTAGSLSAGDQLTFVSKTTIPFSEKPKKDLQLLINNGTSRTVIGHLPNPAINNLKSEVHIKV